MKFDPRLIFFKFGNFQKNDQKSDKKSDKKCPHSYALLPAIKSIATNHNFAQARYTKFLPGNVLKLRFECLEYLQFNGVTP